MREKRIGSNASTVETNWVAQRLLFFFFLSRRFINWLCFASFPLFFPLLLLSLLWVTTKDGFFFLCLRKLSLHSLGEEKVWIREMR